MHKHTELLDSSAHLVVNNTNGLNGLTHIGDKAVQMPGTPPTISVPLKTPEWGDELSNRVVWMIQHDVQTASIKINPPHLGPLEVHVSMNKDHVDVSFNSHHIAVKEALDVSMPKLRELLGNSGLHLGDANVTHHSFSDQNQYNPNDSTNQYVGDGTSGLDTAIADDEEIGTTSLYQLDEGIGAIDYYA